MACARKVYSYGVKKKGEDKGTPWAGMIKDDTKKVAKVPPKKSVWTKVTAPKTLTSVNKVFDDSYDPFELPDDIVDKNDDDDMDKRLSDIQKKEKKLFKSDKSLSTTKEEKKLPKTLYGSPKNSNYIKTKLDGTSPKEKLKSLKAQLMGSPRKGQPLSIPAKAQPIGSPNKAQTMGTSRKAQTVGSPSKEKTIDTSSKAQTIGTSSKTKIIGSSSKAETIDTPKECDDSSLPQKDSQKPPKTLGGSPRNSNIVKSKILGKPLPQNSVTINAEELKYFGSPKRSDGNLTPEKNGRKVSKIVRKPSTKTNVIKTKTNIKSPKKNVTKNIKETKLLNKPKKSNVKNGPSKLAKHKLSQNSIKTKKQTTKNSKTTPVKKLKCVTSIKNSPKGNKKQTKGKIEVKKTMLDTKKVSPLVKLTKAKIDRNVTRCDDGCQSKKPIKKNSVLKSKSQNGKVHLKDVNALSVQFIDDNTVLAIKQKDVRHICKDDVVFSNESSDASESNVTEEENDTDSMCSEDAQSKGKRSLFSYYDRHNSQINPNLNGNTDEFEFSVVEDDIDLTEESPPDNKISLPLKRPSIELPDVPAKKSKQEDVLEEAEINHEDKNVLEQDDFTGPQKSKKKSPFKSFKASAGLKQRKDPRRFSSLPTDVTLNNTEDFEEEKTELETPPPLYRTNIFGFGKGGTPVRVRRDEKELYTVVRNTKHAHECLEYGESQQFKDDLEYLLDGLKSKHNVSTRCLSALELASKCLSPEFRMHIKAHGLIESIFTVLEDALSEEQLLLCASMIMYVLAKDKLKINFNKKTIGFMLEVITQKRADVSKTQAYERMMKKIRAIFEKLEDVDIDLDNIDAKVLAREALLSLTVKRTGEWFKDEIRELGGLDDIAEQVYNCCQCIRKRKNVDQNCIQMKRCLSLFIDMTYKSGINQAYLISCRNSVVIESCVRTLHTISTTVESDRKVTVAVAECLMSIQLLLMNLSHENDGACSKICKQGNGLSSVLRSALHLSQYLPPNIAYENTIVSLCLLVNLVANNPQNRTILNKTVTTKYVGQENIKEIFPGKLISPVEALMQMFLLHAEACKEADLMQELEKLEQEENEQNAGRLYQDDEYGLTCGDKFEDTIDDDEKTENLEGNTSKVGPLNETEKRDIQSTLDKAQKHMEDSHLAAYTALLIGLLIEDESSYQELVRTQLPEGNFSLLLDSIEKIVSFMEMTTPLSKKDHETMKRIMQVIRTCNEQYNEKG